MLNNKYLLTIAFVSGMSVMAFEVSASRLLAPFFGTSLFVWSNILGVVLVALSVGYYIGGKMADKRPEIRVLLKYMLAAGFFFLVVPLIIKPIASAVTINTFFLTSGTVIVFISSLIVALVLFALPLMVLGMVSPFVIKLYSLSDRQIGEVSGSVFALSTIGSILGTFLPTLWLIPTIGTRRTIMIFAIVLILLAGYGLFKRKAFTVLMLVVLIPLPTMASSAIKSSDKVIHEKESVYQYIQVKQASPEIRYLIFNEGGGIQSIYNADNPLTHGVYYDYYSLLPYLIEKDEPQDVLLLGLAGGSISRQLHHFFPGEVSIDGVEIDKEIIKIARQYFELDNPDLTVHNQDGRIFIQNSDKTYDIMIVDAYNKQLYIAWNLTTQEFWQSLKDKLNDGGVVALNINATSTDSELLQSVSNTIASVFPHVIITPTGGEDSWNYMILASADSIDLSVLAGESEVHSALKLYGQSVVRDARPVIYDNKQKVLTDDWAPVEFMTDKMIYSFMMQKLTEND